MKKENVYLINVYPDRTGEEESVSDLEELALLADTAGGRIAGKENLLLREVHAAFFLGQGRLDRIKERVGETAADLVIINAELKPVQVRNLEEFLGVRVIGRTELILDIFSKRARTNEARIQVELAQLRYLMPRLTGFGVALSRLGGGIGTRGPGEKKLETDRRHISRRIHTLEKKLKDIGKHRRVISSRRPFKVVGLAGYTNTGKTSLLNSLANQDLKTENRLFVTLDTATRRIYLDENRYVLLTDTVGLIKNLPHDLVASFRTTLAEVREADLVLHLADISDRNFGRKIAAVQEVLDDLEVEPGKIILVFNKIDRVPEERVEAVRRDFPEALFVSAREKINLEKLKEYILFRTGA